HVRCNPEPSHDPRHRRAGGRGLAVRARVDVLCRQPGHSGRSPNIYPGDRPLSWSRGMSVQALQGQLRTLRSIIEDLPDDLFKAKISQASGSIGEHVRHALDHARALLVLTDGDDLTYDARLRGTPVETHADVAACEIGRVCGDLEQLAVTPPERPLRLHLIAEAGRRPSQVTSTL